MDITNLTLEELAALKAQLDGLTDVSGRSPIKPRQLHDLRLLPTKDDPRPTFFWSAEAPRNAIDLTKTTPYPRLMWHSDTGHEITVSSASAQQTETAQGFVLAPPADAPPIDPLAALTEQLEALPEEDRALLVAAQRQDRMTALREKLAALPEDKLAAVLATVEGSSEVPAKRGPGRPRKEVA